MNFFKPLLIFLLVAMAMVAKASPIHDFSFQDLSTVGDLIGAENEMMLDSESGRRELLQQRRRYISYGALRANRIPCGYRGRSYYDCQRRRRANPYNRGCTAITRCQRRMSY